MTQSTQTKKKGSFRTNVILTFLVISLVSLSATGVVSLTFVDLIGGFTRDQSSLALQTQIEINMEKTAQKTALVINQKLASAQGMIEAAAAELESLFDPSSTYANREVYFHELFENDTVAPAPPDNQYNASYGLNVSWSYSSWFHRNYDSSDYLVYETAESDKLGTVSNMDYIFKSIHDQIDFRWLYIAFADDGLFINYPGSELDFPGYDPRVEYWYTEIASGSGDIVYVDPYYDEFDDVLLISIGKLVYSGGLPLAVISGDITISDIQSKVIDVSVLESGYAFLLNSLGEIVAHPELDDTDYGGTSLPYLLDTEQDLASTDPLTETDMDTIRTVQMETSGSLRYTRNGKANILVFTPVGKGGYICVISVPLDEVLEAIPPLETRIAAANAEAAAFILFATIGGIVLAGIVAVSVSNTITRPLQYLMDLATRNAAARIRDEPLDTAELQVDQSYISKDDEIGELARAFQGMLDTIREDEE
ncbi:HAMP domain-containing protein [Candidatus Thorarchaeota archaeon]|nr:MAG: HAMP domain-containing protein [Candidatus Thorarchaeota archaeon]